MAENDIRSKALVPSEEGPRFSIGDAVRVRAGVIDPDFPDIPITGWAGMIVDIEREDPLLYLVQWTQETLSRVTPAYRVRCDREGKDNRVTYLVGTDLEPDTGGPLVIVQPTRLRPAPLDRDDPQDRIRGIFKLTSDDPLPKVDEASLRRFHEHFRKKLKTPVAATCTGAPSSQKPAMLLRLMPFDERNMEDGLLAQVEQGDQIGTGPLYDISLLSQNAVSEDIDAYSEWFFEEQDEEAEEDEEDEEQTKQFDRERDAVPGDGDFLDASRAFRSAKSEFLFFGRVSLVCILVGALVGALLWVHDWAMVMAEGGAIVLGFVGGIVGVKTRFVTLPERNGLLTGIGLALTFTLMGALIGGTIGVLLLSYVGAIPGALAGTLFGTVLTACGVRNHSTFYLAILGSYIGAVVYAFWFDASDAFAGALRGAGGGLGAGVLVLLGSTWVMSRISRPLE